jgi:hypothetical protein
LGFASYETKGLVGFYKTKKNNDWMSLFFVK